MIGAAAGGFYLTTGRITGISGIFSNTFLGAVTPWRVAFVTGLIAAGIIARLTGLIPPALGSSPLLLIIAGLFVGFGTKLGNGCTSGHGVCGLSRLSLRSLTAVAVFMGVAALTVFVMRHVI